MHLLLLKRGRCLISRCHTTWSRPSWHCVSEMLHRGALARINSVQNVCMICCWPFLGRHHDLILVLLINAEFSRVALNLWRNLRILVAAVIPTWVPALLLLVATCCDA